MYHMRARFGHLVGYGGMYYSYLYATALAAALWRTHFAADPLSREAGASVTTLCALSKC